MAEQPADTEVTKLRIELSEARTDKKFADMLGEMRAGFAELGGRIEGLGIRLNGRIDHLGTRIDGLERSSSSIKQTVIGTGLAVVALIAAMVIGMLAFGQAGFGLGLSARDTAKAAATEALQQERQVGAGTATPKP